MIWEYKDFNHMEKFWKMNSFSIVILILSLIVLFLALVGCCGALRGSVITLRLVSFKHNLIRYKKENITYFPFYFHSIPSSCLSYLFVN